MVKKDVNIERIVEPEATILSGMNVPQIAIVEDSIAGSLLWKDHVKFYGVPPIVSYDISAHTKSYEDIQLGNITVVDGVTATNITGSVVKVGHQNPTGQKSSMDSDSFTTGNISGTITFNAGGFSKSVKHMLEYWRGGTEIVQNDTLKSLSVGISAPRASTTYDNGTDYINAIGDYALVTKKYVDNSIPSTHLGLNDVLNNGSNATNEYIQLNNSSNTDTTHIDWDEVNVFDSTHSSKHSRSGLETTYGKYRSRVGTTGVSFYNTDGTSYGFVGGELTGTTMSTKIGRPMTYSDQAYITEIGDNALVTKKYVDDNASSGGGLWQETSPTGILKPKTVHAAVALAINDGKKLLVGTETAGGEGKVQILVSDGVSTGGNIVISGGSQDGTYVKEANNDQYGFSVYKNATTNKYISKDSSPSHPYWCIASTINPVYYISYYVINNYEPDGTYHNPVNVSETCNGVFSSGVTDTGLYTNGTIKTDTNIACAAVSFTAGAVIGEGVTSAGSKVLGFNTSDTDQVAYIFASNNTPRLAIASPGIGNATQMYESALFGGYTVGSEQSDNDTKVANLSLFDSTFINCSSGSTGATAKPDVGIGGALQVIDQILVGSRAVTGDSILISDNKILMKNGTTITELFKNTLRGVQSDMFITNLSHDIKLTTPTGKNVLVDKDPTVDMAIATKRYVDSHSGGSGNSTDYFLIADGNGGWVESGIKGINGALGKAEINAENRVLKIAASSIEFIQTTTNAGSNGTKLTKPPIADTDIVNKKYVDDNAGATITSGTHLMGSSGSWSVATQYHINATITGAAIGDTVVVSPNKALHTSWLNTHRFKVLYGTVTATGVVSLTLEVDGLASYVAADGFEISCIKH